MKGRDYLLNSQNLRNNFVCVIDLGKLPIIDRLIEYLYNIYGKSISNLKKLKLTLNQEMKSKEINDV